MNELVAEALELLPKSGTVDFDVYKAQLNTAMPDKAKDVFMYILKNDLLVKKVKIGEDHKAAVLLSRKV